MKLYAVIALVALSLLLAANATLRKIDTLKADNARLALKLGHSQQEAKENKAVALELNKTLEHERALQRELQHQQSMLSSQLDQSKTLISRLKRENKELSDWAATDLPAAIKRLRERPHITGAGDYQNWLSSRNRMHAQSDQPRN